MAANASRFDVVEFGPTRAIGFSLIAKGGKADFPGLWQHQLMPRKGEITKPEKGVAFGICRCVPGMTDGSFEYLALLEATADAPVPPGMVALDIPRGPYASFAVIGYDQLGPTWRSVPAALAAHPEWEPWCGPKGCQCAAHPSFEVYPWEPDHTNRAYIYVAIKRA